MDENSGQMQVGDRQVPISFVRNARARRYVLRLRRNGMARVTIPRGGSLREAKAFAERNAPWLGRQFQRLSTQPKQPSSWQIGSLVLLAGELVPILAEENGEAVIRFGGESVRVPETTGDLRPLIERHLRRVATRELPPLVAEFAARHRLTVRRVTVRNQKSRWGSCSRRGTISLNWRLVQTPGFVRDYIILHELMHLREMNHSSRFWREVAGVCPEYQVAERWLKEHSALLR